MTFYAGTTNVVLTFSTGVDLTTVTEAWVAVDAPGQDAVDVLGDILDPATGGNVQVTLAAALVAGTYWFGVLLKYPTRDVTVGKASIVVKDTLVPSDPSP